MTDIAWTASFLPLLNRQQLDEIYDALPPGEPPLGTYDGVAWINSHRLSGHVWKGKVFDEKRSVVNRLLRGQLVRGCVGFEGAGPAFTGYKIDYGRGLVDTLREVTPGLYLCKFFVYGRFVLYFTLRKVDDEPDQAT